jgi:hypothetical protein
MLHARWQLSFWSIRSTVILYISTAEGWNFCDEVDGQSEHQLQLRRPCSSCLRRVRNSEAIRRSSLRSTTNVCPAFGVIVSGIRIPKHLHCLVTRRTFSHVTGPLQLLSTSHPVQCCASKPIRIQILSPMQGIGASVLCHASRNFAARNNDAARSRRSLIAIRRHAAL